MLAAEVAGSGVTANLLYPGNVDTALQEDLRSVDTTGTRMELGSFHALHAEGGLAIPERIADLIYWLVGPWSRTYNGEFWRAGDAEWMAQVQRDLA